MKTALSILILCACIGSCSALQCYSCFGCGDPFDSSVAQKTTCPDGDGDPMCLAVSIGGSSFVRGCGNSTCQNGCIDDICTYCCADDLCNDKSIANETSAILQCYFCVSTDGAGPCVEPFDPSGDGVLSLPCANGQCGVQKISIPGGSSIITRACFDPSQTACTPGCSGFSCMSCCSTSLCNGDDKSATESATVEPTKESAATAKPVVATVIAALAVFMITQL